MKFPFRMVYIIIFLIVIVLSGIYLATQQKVEAAKVTVEITKDGPFNAVSFNESERDELIGNISLDKAYVKKLAAPKGSEMYMPGMSVALFRNKIMISDWTSVPIQERGIYKLVVGLNQPINKGDTVSIAVYINDDKGKVVIGKKGEVVWD